MSESTMQIQEYFESYVPDLIEGYLAREPVPEMEGTSFTSQVTIEGEKSLSFGMTIDDAKEITVQQGALTNPMISITIPEDAIRHVTKQISGLTGRKQYEAVSKTKGTLTLEMSMPDDWVLPVTITFNGATEPKATMSGPAEVLAKVMTGELQSPKAFMEGKIKITGDMMFLMSLANLIV